MIVCAQCSGSPEVEEFARWWQLPGRCKLQRWLSGALLRTYTGTGGGGVRVNIINVSQSREEKKLSKPSLQKRTYIHTCAYVQTRAHLRECARMCVRLRICTHVHSCMHVCAYIRVYHTRHFSFKILGSIVFSILGTHSMSPTKGFLIQMSPSDPPKHHIFSCFPLLHYNKKYLHHHNFPDIV